MQVAGEAAHLVEIDLDQRPPARLDLGDQRRAVLRRDRLGAEHREMRAEAQQDVGVVDRPAGRGPPPRTPASNNRASRRIRRSRRGRCGAEARVGLAARAVEDQASGAFEEAARVARARSGRRRGALRSPMPLSSAVMPSTIALQPPRRGRHRVEHDRFRRCGTTPNCWGRPRPAWPDRVESSRIKVLTRAWLSRSRKAFEFVERLCAGRRRRRARWRRRWRRPLRHGSRSSPGRTSSTALLVWIARAHAASLFDAVGCKRLQPLGAI